MDNELRELQLSHWPFNQICTGCEHKLDIPEPILISNGIVKAIILEDIQKDMPEVYVSDAYIRYFASSCKSSEIKSCQFEAFSCLPYYVIIDSKESK